MIVEMEKLFLYGLQTDRQRVLSDLQQAGCVQIENPERLPEYQELADVMQRKVVDLYDLEQRINRCQSTISALSPYAPKKSFLAKRPRVSFAEMQKEEPILKAEEICEKVEELTHIIAEHKSAIAKEEFSKASFAPWQALDLPLSLTATAETRVDYVILPASAETEALTASMEEAGLSGILTEQSADKDQKYLLLVSHKKDFEEIWNILRAEGAARASFEGRKETPAREMALCDERIAQHEQDIAATEEKLAAAAADIGIVKQAYDALSMRHDCGGSAQNLLHTDKTFLLMAWVPADRIERISGYLDCENCYYEFAKPAPDEDYPIQLKNNKLAEPFEVVTEMYSLPAPNSIDPNPFMALFYFIFFGMMLSDAGYGLLLIAGSLFAIKKMELSPFVKKFMTLIFYGGISTVIWGALYGSWFGNLIPQVASTFFGKTVTIPALLDPLNEPITILVISFALGILHLFTGMALKAYLLIRRGHPWDAVFDVFFWYGLLIGLGMLFLPGAAGTIGKYLAIGCAVGLVLTQGRDKKNVFMRLGSGLLSLYDITSYFSDILSYSRILALGLATGVIANVVNTMGTLLGGNFIGLVVFILVFIGGHALNLAINALGTYVHDCRLQYVEFFGKFYESGGKPFMPLRVNTKYVTVTNEED